MDKHTVALADGTVGEVIGDSQVGDVVVVKLHDENGMPITAKGVVEEILI